MSTISLSAWDLAACLWNSVAENDAVILVRKLQHLAVIALSSAKLLACWRASPAPNCCSVGLKMMLHGRHGTAVLKICCETSTHFNFTNSLMDIPCKRKKNFTPSPRLRQWEGKVTNPISFGLMMSLSKARTWVEGMGLLVTLAAIVVDLIVKEQSGNCELR